MAFESDSLPMPATVTTQPAPVQTDMRTDCKAWYLMRGLHTCQLIASMFGAFSLTDFIAWHPAVKADCSGLQVHMHPRLPLTSSPLSSRLSSNELMGAVYTIAEKHLVLRGRSWHSHNANHHGSSANANRTARASSPERHGVRLQASLFCELR